MSQFGELIAPDTIRFVRVLSGDLDLVWDFLTVGSKRKQWLADGDVELQVGGHVSLHFHNASLSNEPDDGPPPKYADMPEKVSYHGTVTKCEPKTLLAHTWEGDGELTEVTYSLRPVEGGVELTLVQRKLTDKDMLYGASGGWHTHLDILSDVISGKPPKAFWRVHTLLESEYRKRFGP